MSTVIVPAILWVTGLAALVAGAAVDFRHRIVPNRLVLVVALCGSGLRLWSAPGSIWLALLAAALLIGGLGLLAHREWIGGGDVKLIGAVSLLFRTVDLGELMLSIAIAGGLMGLVYLVVRSAITRKTNVCPAEAAPAATEKSIEGHIVSGWGRLLDRERMRIVADEPMPYAVAILGGVLFWFVNEAVQCLSATSCSL